MTSTMITDRRRQQQEEEGAETPSRAGDSSSSRQFRTPRAGRRSATPRRPDAPSAHDSDPHTTVPVCRDYGLRYGNLDGSDIGKPNENRTELNETEEW
ncbi:hypothetical protein ALC62_00825 [Cyphomyrmex costatus]|uniref:Uncharacterized protein n=1 Tax=Cyphomyrmex costatus TaxID=456900 RepID=A0A151IPX6_9HYME|nr:hypothetical protein ALC62_00825 [Cyphomyrmex costatus]